MAAGIDEVFDVNRNNATYSKVPSDEQSDMSEEFSINVGIFVDREGNNSKDQRDAPINISEEDSGNEVIFVGRTGNNSKDQRDASSNISEEGSGNEVIFVGRTGSKSKDQTDGRSEETTDDGSGEHDYNENGSSVCEEIEVEDESSQRMELDNSSGNKHKKRILLKLERISSAKRF